MPYCPSCGSEVGFAKFCPNCGARQGDIESGGPQKAERVYVSTGHQYDETICLILCCCLSPIAALIYYLLTEHPSQQYRSNY
jgi:hypothetical protein